VPSSRTTLLRRVFVLVRRQGELWVGDEGCGVGRAESVMEKRWLRRGGSVM